MRSIFRWSAALGLASSIVLGSLFTGALEALALTREQIIQRLGHVPVFTLTDAQGAPLVSSQGEGQRATTVTGVFISRADAQRFLDTLRSNNPQLANSVRVTPVSLAEVYELASQQPDNANRVQFSFVPVQQEVQSALQILQRSGQTTQRFEGVPLFIARSSSQQGGYLTIRQGDREVVPIFFSQAELQAMLDRLRPQQPDLVNQVTIQVTSLEGVIQMLQSSNNEELNQIFLVPPQDSVEYIRTLQPQPGQGQTPANRPAGQSQNQARPTTPPAQNQARPAQPTRR